MNENIQKSINSLNDFYNEPLPETEQDWRDEVITLGVLLRTEEQLDSWLSYSLENVPN